MPIKRRILFSEDEVQAGEEKVKYRDVHEALLTNRIVFLTEDVTADLASRIIAVLIYLDTQGSDPIKLYINSPGGDIDGLFGIYDTMNMISAPIQTICIGEASSCAAIILAAGTPGLRMATSNSSIMIHQMWVDGAMEGTATAVEMEAKAIKNLKRKLTEMLARHSGQTYQQVYEDCEYDKYMTAKEAKAYGIIDKIIYSTKPLPKLLKK